MSNTVQAKHALVARLLVAGALLIFFALAVATALDKSPTNDEPVHLTRAAALYQSRDFSLQFEHPPLSHWLIGALFSTEPNLPQVDELPSRLTGDRLDIAAEFLWQHGVDVERLTFLGRMPIIWGGLLLGTVLALWTMAVARRTVARLHTGYRRALGALATVMVLYAVSSNLIASAALATTDFVATLTYFAAVCAWWFYWQRPSWGRWLVTAALLGLVLAAKLTGVLLIPVLLLLAYVYPREGTWWRPALRWLGLLPVAALVLWLTYAFTTGRWLGVLVPAPAYWESWTAVLTHVGDGHQAFFLGRLSSDGWWLYFPVALLIKTPLVWLILIAAALVLVVRRRVGWRVAVFTLLPAAALFTAAVISRLNIGYRHILPITPFLLVLMGHALPALWSNRVARWAVGAGVALTAVFALWVHPDHLAAFNLAVGGPAQGYRYLGDSNLDWGQDLRALAEYVAAADTPVAYSYAGSADPAYYGLTAPSLSGPDGRGRAGFSPANPAPGRYAVSANHLQGVLGESDLFDWFRRRSPDDSLGYSILIYDVPQAQTGEWIAHCINPGPALSTEAAENLLGVTDVRHVFVDCNQTQVWPGGGLPGWTIAPGLSDAGDVIYSHRATAQAPDYSVVYSAGSALPPAYDPPANITTTTGERVSLPQPIGGVAELQNYQISDGQWATVWRVLASTDAPLSIQAHLLDAGGNLLAVGDSLGYSSEQWQPGDVFIQRFNFDPSLDGAFMEIGLYDYVTLEPSALRLRLPVTREPQR